MRQFLFATMVAIAVGGATPPVVAEHLGGPGAEARDPENRTSERRTGLSKANYLSLLAAEIRRHTPRRVDISVGSADVASTIGASGRVAQYEMKSVTNRAQVEPFVRRIMAAIRMPPPGGAFEAMQSFRFSD